MRALAHIFATTPRAATSAPEVYERPRTRYEIAMAAARLRRSQSR